MQKIHCKKLDANIQIVSAMMLICLVGLMLAFGIRYKEVKLYRQKIKDGLDMACLAAAVIDKDVYNESGQVRIADIDGSFSNFRNSLICNLDLNNDLTPKSDRSWGKVNLHELYIFNITHSNSTLEIYSVKENGSYYRFTDPYDPQACTPDGKRITTSTVYADIGLNIKGLFGEDHYVHTISCVDVTKRKDDE